MSISPAWEVYSKACAVCVGLALADTAVERRSQALIGNQTLRWALAFIVVQASAIAILAGYLVAIRTYAWVSEKLYSQIHPAIRDRVLALAFEGEVWSSEIPAYGPARRVLEETLAHSLATLKGAGRDRVARFAVEQGFGALLAAPAPADLDTAFRSALSQGLLARALLAGTLKKHAPELLANTIPSLLAKCSDLEATRCFEILISWKRALPSFDIVPWLRGPHESPWYPSVLALLPYVPLDGSIEDYVSCALRGANVEVQCAAAQAAGRLGLTGLIPLLSSSLGQSKRFALVSAAAVAQMGDEGKRYLEKIVVGPDRSAAKVALEALEQVTVRAH